MSRGVCRRLQEVECAFLFSSFVQCRTAQRFGAAGNDAGIRYDATFTAGLPKLKGLKIHKCSSKLA